MKQEEVEMSSRIFVNLIEKINKLTKVTRSRDRTYTINPRGEKTLDSEGK